MIASVVLGITPIVWVHDLPAVQAANASKSISQTKTTLKTLANVPGVKLSNKSSVKISDVNVLTQDEGKLVTYTLTYTNNEKKACSWLIIGQRFAVRVEQVILPNCWPRMRRKKCCGWIDVIRYICDYCG